MVRVMHANLRPPAVFLLLVASCSGGGPSATGLSSGAATLSTSGASSSGGASSGEASATGSSSGGVTGGEASTSTGTSAAASSSGAASEAGGSSTGEPSEHVMIQDPLVGGTTGTALGGSFGDAGWTVTAKADRIFWAVPRLVEGSVEFTIAGVTLANLPLNDHEVFSMYEGGFDIAHPIPYNPEFRNNAFKSMIRIYGTAEVGREGQQKIMWGICPMGTPGYHDGACPCTDPAGFFDEPFGGDGSWDGSPQRLRIEWKDGVTRYLRNDAEVLSIDWASSGLSFGPEDLHVSLGSARADAVDTAGMPIGAVFSDLTIEGWTGPASSTCG